MKSSFYVVEGILSDSGYLCDIIPLSLFYSYDPVQVANTSAEDCVYYRNLLGSKLQCASSHFLASANTIISCLEYFLFTDDNQLVISST